MSDQDIREMRRSAQTPLEKFMAVIALARTDSFGLAYCRDDDEINAAAREGKRITAKLMAGDVIYVEIKDKKASWSVTKENAPFVAVVCPTSDNPARFLPIDLLGGRRHENYVAGATFVLSPSMHRVCIWLRDGAPCT